MEILKWISISGVYSYVSTNYYPQFPSVEDFVHPNNFPPPPSMYNDLQMYTPPAASFYSLTTIPPQSTEIFDNNQQTTTPNPSNITVEELISDCVDLYKECPDYAKNNYCTDYRKQMLFQCRKSCDFCDIHPLDNSSDSDDNDDDSDDNDNSEEDENETDNNKTKDDDEPINTKEAEKSQSTDTEDDQSDIEKPEDSNEDDTQDDQVLTIIENIKKSGPGKSHTLHLVPRSPLYNHVIGKETNNNFAKSLSRSNYAAIKEKFQIPGFEPTAEEIYAETGQIAAAPSSLEKYKHKRTMKNKKRSSIPHLKNIKPSSPDPYQYLRKMDTKKESMIPIGDSRQHPENSSLFKSSVDSIKKFFYSRKKRSGENTNNNKLISNHGNN